MQVTTCVTLIVVTAALSAAAPFAQATKVSVTFASQNNDPKFDAAAGEYRRIWGAEGARIIGGMEQITSLTFPDREVRAEIYEGPSFSGGRAEPGGGRTPMVLRASYPAEEKKGTLVHELGHRMNGQLTKRPIDLDEHRLLFLYLYDLYVNLYGKEFADREVAFGRTLKGIYDYDAAWTWALAMTVDTRRTRFADVVKANRKSPAGRD